MILGRASCRCNVSVIGGCKGAGLSVDGQRVLFLACSPDLWVKFEEQLVRFLCKITSLFIC
jgi:hypothetical protein